MKRVTFKRIQTTDRDKSTGALIVMGNAEVVLYVCGNCGTVTADRDAHVTTYHSRKIKVVSEKD